MYLLPEPKQRPLLANNFVPTDIFKANLCLDADSNLVLKIEDLPAGRQGKPHQSMLKNFFRRSKFLYASRRKKYAWATFLDLILIIIIIINGIQPAQRLISPIVTSLKEFQRDVSINLPKENFAFAPGLSSKKFDDINFDNLNTLAFFDVPISEDGSQIDRETRGYTAFTSEEAQALFEKAHLHNTKVLLTIYELENSKILNLLNSSDIQQKLISDISEEINSSQIDGAAIDFEYNGSLSSEYQKKYADFLNNLKNELHNKKPGSKLAVVIPSDKITGKSYNLKSLAYSSDKIFIMASDFIVPETKNNKPQNPIFGFNNEKEYWNKVSDVLQKASDQVPKDKLALETAWYGNGDDYPLYVPTGKPVEETEVEPAHVLLDQETVDRFARSAPKKARDAAKKNIPLIGNALREEGILDSNVLAYALATIEHETDATFEPVDEIQGRRHARRFGYEGGTNYFGRGFIQLTHLRNYKKMGERIGMGDALAKDPTLASKPEVAAKILAAFFRDNNIANLASRGSFIAARRPINPDYNGYKVASIAWKYWEEGAQ